MKISTQELVQGLKDPAGAAPPTVEMPVAPERRPKTRARDEEVVPDEPTVQLGQRVPFALHDRMRDFVYRQVRAKKRYRTVGQLIVEGMTKFLDEMDKAA